MKRTMIVLAMATLAGCVPGALIPTRHYTLSHTFNPADVAWADQRGTATLTGQAFFQTGGGTPRTCAGLEVGLVPQSAYADERMQDIYGHGSSSYVEWRNAKVEFNQNDLGYQAAIKKVTCDAQGNFTFNNLAAGTYYVTASIVWEVPPYGAFSGGLLMKRVTLKDGEMARMILTP